MEKEDEKLVADFLGGSDAAFELLISRHLKPVFNFVFQLVKDKATAEDIAQETFFKAWKNIKKFDPSRSRFATLRGKQNKNFKTWLFAIAKNTAFDYFKKKKTLPFAVFEREDGSNKLEEISDDNFLPDEILQKKDLAKDLEIKLQSISEQYRLILLMRYKEDFSLQEISEILNLPYNTVKSQHQRALMALRKLFFD